MPFKKYLFMLAFKMQLLYLSVRPAVPIENWIIFYIKFTHKLWKRNSDWKKNCFIINDYDSKNLILVFWAMYAKLSDQRFFFLFNCKLRSFILEKYGEKLPFLQFISSPNYSKLESLFFFSFFFFYH